MAPPTFAYAKICQLEDLTCFVCEFDINEERDQSAKSSFHYRILKNRMIIFSFQQILSAPDPHNDRYILIVFNRNTINTIILRDIINKLNLKIIKSASVTPAMLEMCLSYTLKAKLAPIWNHVDDNLYVNNRDFLTTNTPLDCVNVNIQCIENMIKLEIICNKLRMNQLKIEDFNISPKALDYFFKVPDGVLTEYSLLNNWITVLPSLKKGRIISIYKKMPEDSHFNSYKEMRRHWKNIYGYRLPDVEDNLLFYQVHFLPLGPQLYTYPSLCLLQNKPLKIPVTNNDHNNILNKFLRDVCFKFPLILGKSTNFEIGRSFVDMPWSDLYLITNSNSPSNPNDYDCNTQQISLCTPIQNDNIKNIHSTTIKNIYEPAVKKIILSDDHKTDVESNNNTSSQSSSKSSPKTPLTPNSNSPKTQSKIIDYFKCVKRVIKSEVTSSSANLQTLHNTKKRKCSEADTTIDVSKLTLMDPSAVHKQILIDYLRARKVHVTVKMTKKLLVQKFNETLENEFV